MKGNDTMNNSIDFKKLGEALYNSVMELSNQTEVQAVFDVPKPKDKDIIIDELEKSIKAKEDKITELDSQIDALKQLTGFKTKEEKEANLQEIISNGLF